MAKLFNLAIVTTDEIMYQGQVVSLILPTELGYMGVLADHAPLVANLDGGKIILKEASGELLTFYSEGKGFIEVIKNNVTVLLCPRKHFLS